MKEVNITHLKRYSEVIDGTVIVVPKLTVLQNPDHWIKVIDQINSYATTNGLLLKHSEKGQQGLLQACDKGDHYLLEYSSNTENIQDADIIK